MKARTNAQKEETPYSDQLPPDVAEHNLSQAFRKFSHIAMCENFQGLPPATKPNWGADRVALIAGAIVEESEKHVKVRNAKSNRMKSIKRKDLLPCAEVGIAYRETSTGYWFLVTRRTYLGVHVRCVLQDGACICFSRNHICFTHNHICFANNYMCSQHSYICFVHNHMCSQHYYICYSHNYICSWH